MTTQATLVIAEHDNKALKGGTFNTVSAAAAIGGDGGVVTDYQNVQIATGLRRCRDRIQRCRPDSFPVMLRKHQRRHQITFASVFSFATKVAASGTLIPALRPGGSVTCSVFNLGVTSTPRSAGFKFSSVFFFAFMMLGSVT